MKACVIIPAYNESRTISGIVREVRGLGLDVVVVDDGSQDNTPKIAEAAGAVLLSNTRNQGKGISLTRGFDYALKNGFDAVLTMDGDGQHLSSDIPLFLEAARDAEAAMIVGNRMTRAKNMPPVRYLTNKFMSWMISEIVRQRIPDTQCGFRLIKRQLLEKFQLHTSKFEIESEMLFRAAAQGNKIKSIPVQTVYAHEKSHINPFIDTVRFFRFVLRELWTSRL